MYMVHACVALQIAMKSNEAIRSNPHIFIIIPPNLVLRIAVPGRERKQGRFRGSSQGARGSSEGARASTEGALRRSKRAEGRQQER